MNRSRIVRCVHFAMAIAVAFGTTAQVAADGLDEAFAAAAAYRFGESREPLSVIERAADRAAGDEKARAALELRLVALLDRDRATREAAAFACRRLAVIGGDASAPALAALLHDDELSHMARYALQVIPGDAATTALTRAIEGASRETQVGIVNSILMRARRSGGARSAVEITAETTADERRDLAAAYARVFEGGAGGRPLPRHARYAALRSQVELDPAGAAATVVGLFDDDDPYWRGSAARLVRAAPPGRETTLAYSAHLADDASPQAAALLIAALAERGDAAAGPAIARRIGGAERDVVREAALAALGDVGGVEHVPILLERAADGDDLAASALARMRADGANQVIARRAAGASAAERVAIARALGARRAEDEIETLRRLTNGREPADVRTAAYVALADVGSSPYESLASAMQAARQSREKRRVLEAIESRGEIRLLPLALAWLDSPAVGRDAARTVVAIAAGASVDDADVARDAIEQVVEAYGDDATLRARAGAAFSRLDRQEGFIRIWLVTGPFVKDGVGGGELFDVVFPPEPGAADGASTGVAWEMAPPSAFVDPGILDLKKLLGGDDRVAYVRATIDATTGGPARLEIGSDDGVKAWLNGELVHGNDVMRGLALGQDTVPVTLRPGANELLLKVTQGGGDWRVCCRVRDPDGFRLEGVRVGLPRR